jgi:predicted hydrocarbon binding protein
MKNKKTVYWDEQNGTIMLSRNGSQERVILLRRGFWDGFLPELANILGEDGVSVMMRKLVEKVDLADTLKEKATFRTLIKCFDHRVLPVDKEKSVIHDSLSWEGDDREVTVFGDTIWILQDVFTIQKFKEVLTDVLDENGARAIIRNIVKKGGILVGDTALKNYQWKNMEEAMASQDEKVYRYTFNVAGWTLARSAYKIGADDNYTLLAISLNTYESEGVKSDKPVCDILANYMEGFYEGVFSKLADKSVEAREVKCRAKGDGYCAFVFKVKNDKKETVDWESLQQEWKDLDASLNDFTQNVSMVS